MVWRILASARGYCVRRQGIDDDEAETETKMTENIQTQPQPSCCPRPAAAGCQNTTLAESWTVVMVRIAAYQENEYLVVLSNLDKNIKTSSNVNNRCD